LKATPTVTRRNEQQRHDLLATLIPLSSVYQYILLRWKASFQHLFFSLFLYFVQVSALCFLISASTCKLTGSSSKAVNTAVDESGLRDGRHLESWHGMAHEQVRQEDIGGGRARLHVLYHTTNGWGEWPQQSKREGNENGSPQEKLRPNFLFPLLVVANTFLLVFVNFSLF
jgi:hypothetical protein